MVFSTLIKFSRSALLAFICLGYLAACSSETETYDSCVLQASKNSKTNRQFRLLVESCAKNFPDHD